jgi:hypothetical protein
MASMTVTPALGKRPARTEINNWVPGLGLDDSANGMDEKSRRTSLLFLQLQQSVEDALRWRHARDAKARKVSADIAMRHPLKPAEETSATSHDVSAADLKLTVVKSKPAAPVMSFEEKMKADALEAKARASDANYLPEPLTKPVLDEAYTQLPAGAKQSIETVVNCWRSNQLPASDVLATVRSFVGSSAALKKLFAANEEDDCEVASAEQMRELARLAMSV